MFIIDNNNNNNQSNTSLLSELYSNKYNYIFIIDVSSSASDEEFLIEKSCLNTFVQQVQDNSNISIISFSDNAKLECNNKIDKQSIKADIDKIQYVGGISKSNLNPALEIAKKNIRPNTYVVIISNGPPVASPSGIFKTMIENDTEILAIGFKAETNTYFNTLSPSNILIYDNESNLINYIETYTKPHQILNPFINSIYYRENKIQKSSDLLEISFKVRPSNRRTVFNESEVVITIHPNEYYHGDEYINETKIDYKNPGIINFELEPVCNSATKSLPSKIYFDIKVQGKSYPGYFTLDLTKFAGDFKTDSRLNVYIEGAIGNGKSTIINLLINLFTSGQKIHNIVHSSKRADHTTKKLNFYPINSLLEELYKGEPTSQLIDDVIKNINLVFVDKFGMKENQGNITYSSAVKGCYHPDTHLETSLPNKTYECHCIIFVISLLKVSVDLKDINLKISEAIDNGLQPIVVLTFSDNLSSEEIEKEMVLLKSIQVEKENIFLITPYINNETNRQPSKDLMAWKLLKRVFDISKLCKLNRERFISSVLYKKNEIVGEDNTTTTTTTTTTNGSLERFNLNAKYESQQFKFIAPTSNYIADIKRKIKNRFSINEDIIISTNGCELDADDKVIEVLSNDAIIDVSILSI